MNKYCFVFQVILFSTLLNSCSSKWTEITTGNRPNTRVKVVTNPDIDKWASNEWVECTGTLIVHKVNSENPVEIRLPSISRPVYFMTYDESFSSLPHNIKKYCCENATAIGKLKEWKAVSGLPSSYLFYNIVFIHIKNAKAH